MNNFVRSILVILLLATAIAGKAQNREIKFEHGKWAEILEKSKKENKMIYLDCYTTWCGPCKWMAKNVFTNDTAADFYNANFINVEMDMEKGEGLDLAKKYGIRAYPTMLFLNSGGDVIHRGCGSSPTEAFVMLGKDAINPDKQLATATKKFNSGNGDGAFAMSYFNMMENGCQDYSAEIGTYFASQKESDLISRNNWNIIYRYANDYSTKEFIYLEKNRDAFSKLYTSDSVQNKINKVYSSGLYIAIRKKDKEAFESLKAKVKASGNPDAEKVIMDADLRNYQLNADWNNYASTAVIYVNKYLNDNSQSLNGFAWNFYENITDKTMLEQAAKWAKRSVELQSSYANNDTYAAVLYKLGDKAAAKKAAEDAIALAKISGDDYAETESLLKKIEKLKEEPAKH